MKFSEETLSRVVCLISAHKAGLLGGEKMPEDENPGLEKSSLENYMYFTLPMALNYQRNSYTLWECANRMYQNEIAKKAFDCKSVYHLNDEDIRGWLVDYKVALQKNKQPLIWKTICNTIVEKLDGDIRNLFKYNNYSIQQIKNYINENKKGFPYLSGNKIINYWLYVLEQYTDVKYIDRENITVAPDTHVIQASAKLGIISEAELQQSDIQLLVANRWKELLLETELVPIDVHTPMWLWSRGKFNLDI